MTTEISMQDAGVAVGLGAGENGAKRGETTDGNGEKRQNSRIHGGGSGGGRGGDGGGNGGGGGGSGGGEYPGGASVGTPPPASNAAAAPATEGGEANTDTTTTTSSSSTTTTTTATTTSTTPATTAGAAAITGSTPPPTAPPPHRRHPTSVSPSPRPASLPSGFATQTSSSVPPPNPNSGRLPSPSPQPTSPSSSSAASPATTAQQQQLQEQRPTDSDTTPSNNAVQAPTTASQAARKNVPQPAPPSTQPDPPQKTSNNSVNGSNGTSNSTSTTPTTLGNPAASAKARKERPCDACRRRKSRCVLNEGATKCVLCQFHSQECTFVQSPQPRKRRLQHQTPANSAKNNSTGDSANNSSGGGTSGWSERERKRPTTEPNSPKSTGSNEHAYSKIRNTLPVTDYTTLATSALRETLGLQGNRHSHLVGSTAEYESVLIDLCPFDDRDEYALAHGGSFRRIGRDTSFLLYPDPQETSFEATDAVESIVAPHGEKLVRLYFRIVHPSFPILQQRVFMEKYARSHREFAAPLLAAVYILALKWWNFDPELGSLPKPDSARLSRLADQGMQDLSRVPKLSAVQAGLLLLQRNEEVKGTAWALTAQLVAMGQELGLHLDCSGWNIPLWEKGLRKRLAWALYMQDKWGALTHGRPSHITHANWAVRPLENEDFVDVAAAEAPNGNGVPEVDEDPEDLEKGMLLFQQMVSLTGILADVLDTFFTVEAQYALSGRGSTQKVLERAKPIQIRLKEWFVKIPECLRMDSVQTPRKLSSIGYLHLAYFSTEITLHRQILRTLVPPSNIDPYLLYICRSAAKTRLISAMDFVNRLKPEQLQSFWYFASKLNFALIATFGSLLWATSPTAEEAEFYKARLSEYRWTLRVSSRSADFMDYAVAVLDACAGLHQQDTFRRRGGMPDHPVTLSKFGLGMGVGLGLDSTPPPPPSPGLLLQKPPVGSTVRGAGQLSPVTSDPGEGDDGESEDEDGSMVDADGDEEMAFSGSNEGAGERDFFMIPEREE